MIYAATGHRPDKLGGYEEQNLRRLTHFASCFLKMQPGMLVGDMEVISGMALGWDTAWALAALELKIPLIAAVPFEGQDRMWPQKSRLMYRWILKQADIVKVVCEGEYDPAKMQERNEWMVDECDHLVALWDGSKGGTANCIRYAERFKKPITNLWDLYADYER